VAPFAANVHPDDAEHLNATIAEAARTMSRWHAQYRYLHPTKGLRWIEGWSLPMAEPDGSILWHGYVMDVTERQDVAEALRQSDERFRLALRNAPVTVAAQDRDLRFLWAYNQRTVNSTEVIGKTDTDLFPPDDAVRLIAFKRRALESGAVVREQLWVTSGGRRMFLDLHLEPTRNAGGEITGVGIATVDLTAMKQAEEALRAANVQLAEADRQKSDFLATLSHELRNPLAPICNSIYVLEHAAQGSDAVRRAHEVLRRQADHLTRLVGDLLDMTRITRGEVELQLARIDARDVVRRACVDMRNLFEERGIALQYSELPESTWVLVDPVRLSQMVGNLLHNALKFTECGGKVDVAVRKGGATCEVRVRDTGMGLDPADVDRIFEPFVQAKRTRHAAQGGMGIGLSLVRRLAVKHGGGVRASSAGRGQGAEFILELPLAAASPPAADATESDPCVPCLSVLIVEDNEDAGATLADVLELSGHSVKVVTTGRAGVDAALLSSPDVLICDIGLPDLGGLEVVRAIRAAAGPEVRTYAIALSGYAERKDREEALGAGFDAHLAKPLSLDDLNEALRQAAQSRR